YTVSASYIGYDPLTVSDVKVSADLTTRVDFTLKLSGSEITTDEIEIVGKRNAISPDQSGQIIDKEFIDNSGLRGIQNIASSTAGVVQDEKGTNINIRGGRTNETHVIIDGVLTTNPLNGNSSAYVGNSTLEELAVLTGGFSAEYGNVLSGVINVTTKGGTDIYSGSIECITYALQSKSSSQGYNVYNFSFGGPLIPSKKFSRFINFYGGVERNFFLVENPSWISDQLNTGNNVLPGFSLSRWSGNGKINFDFQSLNQKIPVQLKLGTNIADTKSRRYIGSYLRNNSQNNPEILEDNKQYYAKINHQLSSKTFYELQFNYFSVKSVEQNPFFKDNFYMYGSANDGINITLDKYNQFANSGRVSNNFEKSATSYLEGSMNLTTQLKRNEIKFGGSYKYHTIKRYRVSPLRSINYQGISDRGARDSLKTIFNNILFSDYYGYNFDNTAEVEDGFDGAKHPIIAAMYIQDKVEFKDFTLNAGIRWDYLDANSWRIKDLTYLTRFGDPSRFDDADITNETDATSTFSPRIGFSFPVTNNTIFHAQYGKFIQLPTLENLYIGRDYLAFWANIGGFAATFGNPNLKPEKTTAYEIGVKQQVGDRLSMDLTAYYKETEDLIGIKKYPQLPNALQVYENQDYGTLRGVDFSVDLRRTNRLAMNIAYSLSYASGTGSDPDAAFTATWLGTRQPKLTAPLDYDQRHTGYINVDYRFGKTDVPKGFLGNVVSQFGVNLAYKFNSGRPYSLKDPGLDPFTSTGGGAPLRSTINGAYGPWNNSIDLKVDKTFTFAKRLDLNLYVYVINLLDSRLVSNVWESSGDPGTTGYLNTIQGQQVALAFDTDNDPLTSSAEFMNLYETRSKNVNNFGPPRQIRFGAKLNF
ncbi:MAG: TonB-dependent receptor, partial [Bacteroidota bacterium]|nr:TonB-dependent receptor [Bacteroidota bacterium]